MKCRMGLLLSLSFLLAGCGWTVPELETGKDPHASALKPRDIAYHVRCELALAFYNVFHSVQEKNRNPLDFFASWAAKATLKLIVDEKSNISPSFAATPTGVFSVGGGVTLSAQATRTETIGFFLLLSDLFEKSQKNQPLRLKPPTPCKQKSPILIQSDLKMEQWIESLAMLATAPESISDPFKTGGPLDATSHEIQFIVIASGSLTPTWTLVSATVNPDSPFVGASRTQTDDLLITLGPLEQVAGTRALAASITLDQQHFAAQIGQSVTTAIQSQLRR